MWWQEDKDAIEAEVKRRAEHPEHAAGYGLSPLPDLRGLLYRKNPKVSRVCVRLLPEQRIKLIEYAYARDMKVSEVLRDFIEWWLEKEEKRRGIL